MTDLVVIGAGPAGVLAALRAADLGARATVVASKEFGGMAANDGPVPARALAHAGRLMRDVPKMRAVSLSHLFSIVRDWLAQHVLLPRI